jgi:hypothetical protein
LSAPPAAGLNRQLQPSIRKSTPRRRLEADDYHAISSSATATITTTAAMKISVPLLDMRHIVRRLYVWRYRAEFVSPAPPVVNDQDSGMCDDARLTRQVEAAVPTGAELLAWAERVSAFPAAHGDQAHA